MNTKNEITGVKINMFVLTLHLRCKYYPITYKFIVLWVHTSRRKYSMY